VLPVAEYDVLFRRLGNTFGGDGGSTFGVPDLRAAAPKNCQYCISLFGTDEPDFTELLIGETMISAFSPNARLLLGCAGQSLPTAQYRILEMFMGTQFGGDGKNNFNLPDLRGKAPAKCNYTMAVQGLDPESRLEAISVGELLLLPYEVTFPRLARLCNGELLPVAQNRALFDLIGNRFGGDGKQNFALPNLGAAAPPKFNYYISVRGASPPRS
jgi:microcystin-dependent protein